MPGDLQNIFGSFTLIGFDVRRSVGSTSPVLMDARRREASVLRPACSTILSVDRSVWPSVFCLHSQTQPALLRFADDVCVEPSAEAAYFEAFELWDSLDVMRRYYTPTASGDFGVGFGLLKPEAYGDALVRDSWFDAIHEGVGVTPEQVASDWAFLGFDVVNSGLMSAVSGFGPLSDIAALRDRWSCHLNDVCLFERQESALLFCADVNTRLSDGPFFVVALFLLWDTKGEIIEPAQGK